MNNYKKDYKSIIRNGQYESQKTIIVSCFSSFLFKSMICLIILLATLIAIKNDVNMKKIIYNRVYEDNLSFAKINNLYKKYLGGILPFDNIVPKEVDVFSEGLKYDTANLYKDGVKLIVADNYLIPSLESGMVVYIGEKDNYGKTIIVQGIDGVDIWYGNVMDTDIKLYDYIENGNMLGSTNDNVLYVVFQNGGKFLDYKKYI